MKLYEEILSDCLKEHSVCYVSKMEQVICDRVYEALVKIKKILEEDHLSDQDRFWRIEEIVQVYEELGSDGGNRHDFG